MVDNPLDPNETHWTEIEDATAGLPGVRSFRPMTAEEIEHYNNSKTGKVKVRPVKVKLPKVLDKDRQD